MARRNCRSEAYYASTLTLPLHVGTNEATRRVVGALRRHLKARVLKPRVEQQAFHLIE
jgi:hypothetical protein